jgi:hypothetical protein
MARSQGCERRASPCGARATIVRSRREDRPLEPGEEHGRQQEDREHIERQLQGNGRRGEQRLQRHDDNEVEEIDRVRDAAEVEARASDDAIVEEALGLPEDADRDHAESRGYVGKRELSGRCAFDSEDGDSELSGDRNCKQREQ